MVTMSGGEGSSAAAPLVHPLESAWALSAQGQDGKADKAANWEKNVKSIATISTLEDFWRLFNNWRKVSELPMGCDVHLFKKGILPDWDDPVNVPGGRWIANMPKGGSLDDYWLDTIMAAVGEMLDDDGAVTGVVLSIRAKGSRLAVWTRESRNHQLMRRIGERFKSTLAISEPIDFISHADEKKGNKAPMISI